MQSHETRDPAQWPFVVFFESLLGWGFPAAGRSQNHVIFRGVPKIRKKKSVVPTTTTFKTDVLAICLQNLRQIAPGVARVQRLQKYLCRRKKRGFSNSACGLANEPIFLIFAHDAQNMPRRQGVQGFLAGCTAPGGGGLQTQFNSIFKKPKNGLGCRALTLFCPGVKSTNFLNKID